MAQVHFTHTMHWKVTGSDKQDMLMLGKCLIGTIIRLNIRGSVIKKYQ
jgi:hypothetical protein